MNKPQPLNILDTDYPNWMADHQGNIEQLLRNVEESSETVYSPLARVALRIALAELIATTQHYLGSMPSRIASRSSGAGMANTNLTGMANTNLKRFRSYQSIGTKAICCLEKWPCSSKSLFDTGMGTALRYQYGILATSDAMFDLEMIVPNAYS